MAARETPLMIYDVLGTGVTVISTGLPDCRVSRRQPSWSAPAMKWLAPSVLTSNPVRRSVAADAKMCIRDRVIALDEIVVIVGQVAGDLQQ